MHLLGVVHNCPPINNSMDTTFELRTEWEVTLRHTVVCRVAQKMGCAQNHEHIERSQFSRIVAPWRLIRMHQIYYGGALTFQI